ncbi:MAG: hypothetical protein U0931_01420 [Vulcanimicrobiota bacterium]
MMREDFARLTPETLAALANWGLVKRAQREPFPNLLEGEDGLRAVYADGTETFFPVGLPAQKSSCSCGAPGWCRHRVGALLACAGEHSIDAESGFAPVDISQLEKLVGARLWSKALAQKARGMTVEVLGPPWVVRLPGCTVRFLVGVEAGYCKCDCDNQAACEHWVLAAWALNERGGLPGPLIWGGQSGSVSLVHTQQWLEELLVGGVSGCDSLWQVWRARVTREIAACSWLRVLVDELLQMGAAYQQAATDYSPAGWLFCLVSLALRLRDGSAQALGQEVAWEQELEHTRLFALGCRLLSETVHVYWADGAGQILVQRLPAGSQAAPPLGRLSVLACSQLVSRGVVRRADGSLRFRRERTRHSLTRLSLSWRDLPQPLIWPGQEAWSQQRHQRPTVLLQPPTLARDLWVIPLAWKESGCYDPGAQRLQAQVGDIHGGTLQLRRTHQKECPWSLDALAQALPTTDWMTGFVRLDRGRVWVEPVSLVSAREVVVLDLESKSEAFDWPVILEQAPLDGLSELLREAVELCQQASQLGLGQLLPSFHRRREDLAQRLQAASMPNLSRALSGDWSFWGAALRCLLAAERMA